MFTGNDGQRRSPMYSKTGHRLRSNDVEKDEKVAPSLDRGISSKAKMMIKASSYHMHSTKTWPIVMRFAHIRKASKNHDVPSVSIIIVCLIHVFLIGCGEVDDHHRSGLSERDRPFPAPETKIAHDTAKQWDITVDGDGNGLPPGQGSVRDGQHIYAEQCASCHGNKGQGRTAGELVGGIGSLADPLYPEQTVGSYWPFAPTLFDYIRRSMPPDAPFSLDNEQVYAVSGYILYLNKLIDADTIVDKNTLSGLMMPNRNGFMPIYPARRTDQDE